MFLLGALGGSVGLAVVCLCINLDTQKNTTKMAIPSLFCTVSDWLRLLYTKGGGGGVGHRDDSAITWGLTSVFWRPLSSVSLPCSPSPPPPYLAPSRLLICIELCFHPPECCLLLAVTSQEEIPVDIRTLQNNRAIRTHHDITAANPTYCYLYK